MNRPNALPFKTIFFFLLVLAKHTVNAQETDRQIINRAVDKYCACVSIAKEKPELKGCKIEIDTTGIRLSEVDKTYVLRKILRECGAARNRFDEKQMDLNAMDDFFYQGCNYLNAVDLREFNLIRKQPGSLAAAMMLQQIWEADATTEAEVQVKQLTQHIKIIDDLQSSQNETPDSVNTFKVDHPYFDFLAIEEQSDGLGYRYSIIAREGRLICILTILLSKKDAWIVNEFVELQANRIWECEL